jgi:hypothetical protein
LTATGGRPGPTIEILYFAGCPNYEALVARLPKLLDHAGVKAKIALRQVESEEDATRSRFLGSPTVLVNGRDIEPGADGRTDFGLKCRLYRTPSRIVGMPPDTLVVDALVAETGCLRRRRSA